MGEGLRSIPNTLNKYKTCINNKLLCFERSPPCLGHLGLELSQEDWEEEGKDGGRKGEIEMGHLGFWSLRSHRRRGWRKGRNDEGRGRLRWDI